MCPKLIRGEEKKLLALCPTNNDRERASPITANLRETHPNYPSPFLRPDYAASQSSGKCHSVGNGGAVARG